MSQPATHGLSGLWGVAKQFGHKEIKKFFEMLGQSPAFQRLAGSIGSDGQKIVADLILFLTGMINIPGEGNAIALVNELLDSVGNEFGGLLEKFAKNPDDPATVAEVKGKLETALDKMMNRKVIIIDGNMYVPDNCPHPRRTFQGPKGPKAPEYTRGQAIGLGMKPANCGCFGVLIEEIKPSTGAAASTAKASASLIELVSQLKKKDAELADYFWSHYMREIDAATRTRFAQVFGPGKGGTLEKLEIIASLPHTEWNMALDTMVGAPNEKIEGIVKTIIGKLEGALEYVGKRLSKESDEQKRALQKLHKILDGICPEERRQKPVPQGTGWKTATIVLAIASAIGWGVYAVRASNQSNDNTDTMEVTDGR